MKLRNPPEPVIDKRGSGTKTNRRFAEDLQELPEATVTVNRPHGPDNAPSKALMKQAMASASAALQRMGNGPLPSRRAPKGNNPGSVASMKFPSKTAK